jgi:hypothetical protein
MRASTIVSSWLPPIIWSGLIYYLSSIPGLNSGLGVWDLILRKIAHMTEFGILAALLIRGLRNTWRWLAPAGVFILAGTLSLAYAFSDEVHQAFVPGRGPSLHDVAFDGAGIVIALWIMRRFVRPGREAVFATARKLILLMAVALLSGCGAEAEFKRAHGAEVKGRSYVAWQRYQRFAARHPDHKKAAEAVFRAGWLAQTALGDCDASRAFYDRVRREYESSDPWAALAAFHAENCPDFFPLTAKSKWVEGDSDTGGRNARIESVCQVSSTPAKVPFSSATIERSYFAGTSKFKTVNFLYRKDGATVWEHPPGGEPPRMVLKAPLVQGTRWSSQVGGRTFNYEIVSASTTVTVAAGTFDRCLHVRARADGIPGATNEFYAPSVGRVLSSYSGPEGERRNTELLSFTPGPMEPFYQ